MDPVLFNFAYPGKDTGLTITRQGSGRDPPLCQSHWGSLTPSLGCLRVTRAPDVGLIQTWLESPRSGSDLMSRKSRPQTPDLLLRFRRAQIAFVCLGMRHVSKALPGLGGRNGPE